MSPDETNPQPTIAGRVLSGMAFAAVITGIFVLGEVTRGAASFNGDSSRDSPLKAIIFLSLTLGPSLISLIIPRRPIVMIAGFFMVPYLLWAIMFLLIPPIGLTLLLPAYLWYRAVMKPILAQPLYT